MKKRIIICRKKYYLTRVYENQYELKKMINVIRKLKGTAYFVTKKDGFLGLYCNKRLED